MFIYVVYTTMKSSKLICVFVAILLTLFCVSCSKSNEEPVSSLKESGSVYTKDYFVLRPFHIALPKGYSVENIPHFELGIYEIKDSVGRKLMTFIQMTYYHGAYPISFLPPKNPNEFSEAGRLDTVVTIDGVKTKKRQVYIWSDRTPLKRKSWQPPEIVEFIYYPDQVDSSICENIIRSVKIHSYNKDYMCNIYVSENNSLEGSKMSRMRNTQIKDVQSLTKDIELLPAVSANQDFFEKSGKYLFLADCFMNDEYKGSFHIDESCEIGWNGKYAEKEDILDLLDAMEDKQFKEKLVKKCDFSR